MSLVGRRNRHDQPKPGGSKRQAKLAARAAEREALAAPARPFAGLAGECDMVAMREFVPSATAELAVRDCERTVSIATVLPGAIAALVREECLGGEALLGLQVQVHGPDPAADLAYALDWVRRADAGETLNTAHPDQDTPTLTDLLDASAPLDITVHHDFGWWVAEGVEVEIWALAAPLGHDLVDDIFSLHEPIIASFPLSSSCGLKSGRIVWCRILA